MYVLGDLGAISGLSLTDVVYLGIYG
jgi:hypothetical protein